MNTNKEYESASLAIKQYKEGTYSSLLDACTSLNADYSLASIMWGNENLLENEIVEETIRVQRTAICNSCDKNINNYCHVCVCPVVFITNLKFKSCPLEKW